MLQCNDTEEIRKFRKLINLQFRDLIFHVVSTLRKSSKMLSSLKFQQTIRKLLNMNQSLGVTLRKISIFQGTNIKYFQEQIQVSIREVKNRERYLENRRSK